VRENRVLIKIFGPETEKVTGEWRKLHNRGFTICPLHKVGKPAGKRQVERPGRRWEDIKMVLKRWDGGMDQIDLAQERDKCRAVVNTGSNKRGDFLY
jgi:hypothetical protein